MTLGIDVGGTNLVFGLVNGGQIVRKFSAPWFPYEATKQETLDTISGHIAEILTPDTEKIGIGVPSVVDVKNGIVYDTVNIPSWTELPLKAYLEERFNIPVAVNNDANCYAMGVYDAYPENGKPEVLAVVTLGTGVGMGILDHGRLFIGANCGAGELGSLPYRGATLESYCSKQFFNGTGWDAKSAAQAARSGEQRALELFDDFGKRLGDLLCTVMFAYDPSHIALGGGVAHNYPLFKDAMDARMKKEFPYKNSLERLKIDVFTDDDIPVIGASLI